MFGLADCNNFFVSCERIFNPSLEGTPVVVLSGNDGCVVARSNEAKALNIPMGIPAFKIRDLIQQYNIAVYSGNHILYSDISKRIMSELSEITDNLQIYSIDEAFFDINEMNRNETIKYLHYIHNRLRKNIGVPVSVGAAPTLTLVKIASHYAKKHKECNGIYLLDNKDDIENKLKQTPICDVWGIGRRTVPTLQNYNIKTAYDFSIKPREWVKRHFTILGERTWLELNGIPAVIIDPTTSFKQSISVSRTFGQSITDLTNISDAIATFTASAALKLRIQKSCASTITVYISSNKYSTEINQYNNSLRIDLNTPTSSTIELTHYALTALHNIYLKDIKYRKAGVILSGITPDSAVQLNLFHTVDENKHQKLMKAIDSINNQLGSTKIKLLAEGTHNDWKPKSMYRSPQYSTKIKDAIIVYAK